MFPIKRSPLRICIDFVVLSPECIYRNNKIVCCTKSALFHPSTYGGESSTVRKVKIKLNKLGILGRSFLFFAIVVKFRQWHCPRAKVSWQNKELDKGKEGGTPRKRNKLDHDDDFESALPCPLTNVTLCAPTAARSGRGQPP